MRQLLETLEIQTNGQRLIEITDKITRPGSWPLGLGPLGPLESPGSFQPRWSSSARHLAQRWRQSLGGSAGP